MLDFTNSTAEDFSRFARHLWLDTQTFPSHEQTSQYIVEQLYRELATPEGDPLLALVRIFRWTPVEELPADLRALTPAGEKSVMALTGTYGLEKAWRDRRTSANHRVVPVSKIAVPQRIPMFQEVLGQMGVDIQHLFDYGDIVAVTGRPYHGTFHIQDVPSSKAIVDQQSFVNPYGIQALVGFGGFMAHPTHNAMYLLYAFSRVPVSVEAAQEFFVMQQFVGAALAQASEETSIFNS
jgi:hypothetical protein